LLTHRLVGAALDLYLINSGDQKAHNYSDDQSASSEPLEPFLYQIASLLRGQFFAAIFAPISDIVNGTTRTTSTAVKLLSSNCLPLTPEVLTKFHKF
jgi:hypothetical protein